MTSEKIIDWLKKRRREAFILSSLYSVAAMAGGVIALALTSILFFIAAKIIFLMLLPAAHFANGWSTIAASLIMIVLFIDGIRSVRDDMSIVPLWFLREAFEITPRV